MPKLNIYGLGTAGVNKVKSPIHLKDNELTKAQNVVLDAEEREGALRTRPGRLKHNAIAAAGAIAGGIKSPLGAFTNTLFAGMETQGADNWQKSTDGASFSGSSVPALPVGGQASTVLTPAASLEGRMYYFQDSIEAILRVFDGTTDVKILQVPQLAGQDTAGVGAMIAADGRLFFHVAFFNHGVVVYQYDPSVGGLEKVGDTLLTSTATATDMVWHNDRLWMGVNDNDDDGYVYSIKPTKGAVAGEAAWTLDNTFTAEPVTALGSFQGKIYSGHKNEVAATAPDNYVRSTAGVWASTDTNPTHSGTDLAWTRSFIEYESNLYCLQGDNGTALIVRKFDGSSWSTAYDVFAAVTGSPSGLGQGVIMGGKLYFIIKGGTDPSAIVEDASGSFSIQYQAATSEDLNGAAAVVAV